MQQHYVYQLRISWKREPFYIGKGKGERMYVHLHPHHLKKCRNKHKVHTIELAKSMGRTVFVEVIKSGLTDKQAQRLEKKLIKFYGRRDLKTGCLTNLTNGGDGTAGFKRSLESRRKQSITARSREWTPRDTRSKSGWKHSAEARRKMSEAASSRKRKPHSKETREKQSRAARNRKPISEETRQKLRLAKLGVPRSAEAKEAVSRGLKRAYAENRR